MHGLTGRLALWALGAAAALALASCHGAVSSARAGHTHVASLPRRLPVGCTDTPYGVVSRGLDNKRSIALSFDDGPSSHYTQVMLHILRRMHARATFFEVGRHIERRPGRTLELYRSGMEIGNHSFTHPPKPGYGELAATNRLIRRVTGFEPCLFRPPYGLVDANVLRAAREAHLRTVMWDFDSRDHKNPPAARIRNRVLRLARPGSIVDMHDGGNDRRHTAEALPAIIRGLRARGYRFLTVTQVLGDRFIYRR